MSSRNGIAIFSGSRADLGLLHGSIQAFARSKNWDVTLIRVGHSLASQEDFGEEFEDVQLVSLYTPDGVKSLEGRFQCGLAISQIISKVTDYLAANVGQVDLALIAGDRFEIFACCLASYYANVPIAHIHGGDRSMGGHMDDNARHAITKLSHIHLTVCQDSANRVRGFGEEPSRVYNVGSPVVDNVALINFERPSEEPYAIFTYHPMTLDPELASRESRVILEVLGVSNIKIFITSPNNEPGADKILETIHDCCARYRNLEFIGNCGWRRYLNLLKFAVFAVGNSSSLLTEAPIFSVPSINVGDRQLGRFAPNSVSHCRPTKEEVSSAIQRVTEMDRSNLSHPYGSGGVGNKIVEIVDSWIDCETLLHKKTVC